MKPKAVRSSIKTKTTRSTKPMVATPAPSVPPTAPVVAQPVVRAATPKPAAPKQTITSVTAKIDVGFGNALYIRGQGDGLSWDKGTLLQCVDPSTWVWSTAHAQGQVEFKLLLNDEVWSQGENLTVPAGLKAEVAPIF